MCLECRFPLVTFGNLDQVVRMLEVNFGVYPGLLWCI